jgi:hypothetical protein
MLLVLLSLRIVDPEHWLSMASSFETRANARSSG